MSKERDVLFLCQFFYPDKVSSAMLPFQTATYLSKNGKTVDVITGSSDKKNIKVDDEEFKNINTKRIRYLKLNKNNSIKRLISYFSFMLSMFFQIFKLKKYKVIVVYSNPPILPIIAVLGKKIFGCKVIFVSYDIYPEIAINLGVISKDSIMSRTMSKVNTFVFKNVDQVVALSKDMKSYLLSQRPIEEDKIQVIYNWATEKNSNEDLEIEEFKKFNSNNKLIISYFGNMGKAQDIDTIINVMNDNRLKNKEILFLFAGHGKEKEKLEKLSKENKNIIVKGFLTGNEFQEALSITDVFIVSLESGLGGLAVPSKTYSYIQVGKPIISIMEKSTELSQDISQYNMGISVTNGDYSKIVEEVIDLYNNPNRLKEMEINVKNIFDKKYNTSIQLKKYDTMINELLKE